MIMNFVFSFLLKKYSQIKLFRKMGKSRAYRGLSGSGFLTLEGMFASNILFALEFPIAANNFEGIKPIF